MLKKVVLLCVSVGAAFAMHSVDLNINDKDLEFGARVDVGQITSSVEPDTVFLGGRYLKGDESHSDFNRNNNAFYEGNFLVQKQDVYTTGLTLGMGVKFNYTKADIAGSRRTFTTVPVGIEFDYMLPLDSAVPLYIGGSLYYAPGVLSMNDAKRFFEDRINLDIEIIENARATIGYRSIDTTYDINGNEVSRNYNSSVYVGVKFKF